MVHDDAKKFLLCYFANMGSIQFECKGIFTPLLREGQGGTVVHGEFKVPLVSPLFYTIQLSLEGALSSFFVFF